VKLFFLEGGRRQVRINDLSVPAATGVTQNKRIIFHQFLKGNFFVHDFEEVIVRIIVRIVVFVRCNSSRRTSWIFDLKVLVCCSWISVPHQTVWLSRHASIIHWTTIDINKVNAVTILVIVLHDGQSRVWVLFRSNGVARRFELAKDTKALI